MKKFFATLMVIATLAIMLPLDAFGQSYSYRRVYRNGRWYTVRVYNGRSYNVYNRNRITPREYRNLSRQRYRLYNQRNRITRDGYVTRQESRRWNRSTNRYYRNLRRARNY